MKLFVTVYNDHALFPHFLRHYHELGIDQFHVAASQAHEAAVRQYCAGYPVMIHQNLNVSESVWGDSSAVSLMRHNSQKQGEWVAIVDLDEFIQPKKTLALLCRQAETTGANVVRGIMVDRFAIDGQPPAVTTETANLDELMPIRSRFIRDVMGGCDQKGVLVKGHLMPAAMAGHHRFENERTYEEPLEIAHFKWIDGSVKRLRESLLLVRQHGATWDSEYQKALDCHDRYLGFNWRRFGGAPADKFCLEPVERCAQCRGVIDHLEAAYSKRFHGVHLCRRHQKQGR